MREEATSRQYWYSLKRTLARFPERGVPLSYHSRSASHHIRGDHSSKRRLMHKSRTRHNKEQVA